MRMGLRTYRALRSYGTLGKGTPKVLAWGKLDTRSKAPKGPWRDDNHIRRVKAQPCLARGHGACGGPMDPHHCRKLLPDQLLPRDDALVVPLCREHHDLVTFKTDERSFWQRLGNPHIAFIRSFSAEGAAFLASKGL